MMQLKSDLKQISINVIQTKKCFDSINRIKNILVENFIINLSSEMQNKSNALDCKVKEYEENLLYIVSKNSESCCYCEAFKRIFSTENEIFLLNLIETTNDVKIKSILCEGISYIKDIDSSNKICPNIGHFNAEYINKHTYFQSRLNEIKNNKQYMEVINKIKKECDNNEKYRLDCEKTRSICNKIAEILDTSKSNWLFDIKPEQLATLIQELEAQKRCGDEISHFIDGFMQKIERVKGLNNEKGSF